MSHQLTTNTTALEALKTKAAVLPAAKTIQGTKNATPSKSAQTIMPDDGYDGLAKVTVAAIPNNYEDITTSLADLNTANGGTVATTMTNAVDNTEILVNDEDALIEQAIVALDAKRDDVGGIVRTCAVTIQGKNSVFATHIYCLTTDGPYVREYERISNVTVENVLCDSMVVVKYDIDDSYFTPTDTSISGGGQEISDDSLEGTNCRVFVMPSASGTSITITCSKAPR